MESNSLDNEDFLEKITQTISKHKMIDVGDNVIVSVSGGPDSTALLLALTAISGKFDLTMHVWHLNHQIRPEAGAEADHVLALGESLGIPVTIDERNAKVFAKENRLSLQEAGRELRYELLTDLSRRLGGARIAIGHNADDGIETFFINLLRGAGMTGLRGIPPVRKRIIRPLIECHKNEILKYLESSKSSYLSDPSNQDRRYLRNAVRLDLIPVINDLNPDAIDKLKTTMLLINDEDDWLDSIARQKFNQIADIGVREIQIDAPRLKKLNLALTRRLIRLALIAHFGSNRNIDFSTVQTIIDKTLMDGVPTNIARRARAELIGDKLIIYSERVPFKNLVIDASGGRFQIEDTKISVTIFPANKSVEKFDAKAVLVDVDRIEWPINVRPWQNGDWFVPLGMTGRKKLQDFFVDSKVPRRHRSSIPIFSDRVKVVAIGDLRIDERVKVSDRTKRVALIESPGIIN